MISAWGVEDGVSKSYIPGKGFVSASKVGKATLRQITGAHGQYKGGRYSRHVPTANATDDLMTGLGHSVHSAERDQRLARSGPPITTRIGGKKHTYREFDPTPEDTKKGVAGVTYIRGGKRTPNEVYLNRKVMQGKTPAGRQKLIQHESAHAAPKRTSWRSAQMSVGAGQAKSAREEARASMHEGEDYRSKRASQSAYVHEARQQPRSAFSKPFRATQDQISGRTKTWQKRKQTLRTTGLVGAGVGTGAGAGLYAHQRRKK